MPLRCVGNVATLQLQWVCVCRARTKQTPVSPQHRPRWAKWRFSISRPFRVKQTGPNGHRHAGNDIPPPQSQGLLTDLQILAWLHPKHPLERQSGVPAPNPQFQQLYTLAWPANKRVPPTRPLGNYPAGGTASNPVEPTQHQSRWPHRAPELRCAKKGRRPYLAQEKLQAGFTWHKDRTAQFRVHFVQS